MGTHPIFESDFDCLTVRTWAKMSSELAQTERAFQKQPTVVYNIKKGSTGAHAKRYVRSVGLGYKTPRTAKEGNYVDKKCPFTGVVRKLKMQRTIIVRRDYLHFVKKYGRFEKRHNNMAVHMSPCFMDVEAGDIVTMGECRPLSKTVRFNVIKHTKPPGQKKQFAKF